ncbi:MAG: ribonuclease HII [Candidatus Uhrbacteria bacterium]|nr:ribonuclease HII [Patescibacteria group bacterium]MBU1907336.1 ribonuclease HII [Patescibacteria group bacterium]
MPSPTFAEERALLEAGYTAIVGIDEAGCGALAGPVVAAAVIFPLNSRLSRVRDSKLLSAKARDELFPKILNQARSTGIAQATVEEIGQFGIRQATFMAMRRAVAQIPDADYVLVDGWLLPGITLSQKRIVKGDRTVKSIAAASILAKVTRDRIMVAAAQTYPEYGFEIHKGYCTRVHEEAIKTHGACPIHRTTFKPFHPTLF